MDNKLIESAARKLRLLTIVLHESTFTRNAEFDPVEYPSKISQQSLVTIKSEMVTVENEGIATDMLRAYVKFGVRAVSPKESDDGPDVFYTIEATYRVDYTIMKKISKKEGAEFSNYNIVHNAWPFWRQHVFQTVREGDLVPLEIGLYSLTSSDAPLKKKVSSKKKTVLEK